MKNTTPSEITFTMNGRTVTASVVEVVTYRNRQNGPVVGYWVIVDGERTPVASWRVEGGA